MIRNLKALGLALVAVFAMGAVMASAASAQGKLTSDGPVTLDGSQTGAASANQLSAFGSTVQCTTVTYTGHKSDVTPHALIPSGSSSATINPSYSGCTANTSLGVKPATVDLTSCDFELTIGAATAGGGGWGVTAHLDCDTGDEAHVEIYNDANHTERICTVTFGEQTAHGADVLNTSGGHIGLLGTFTGIVAKREGLCLLDGKGTNTTSATLSTDVTVSGTDENEEPTAIEIS